MRKDNSPALPLPISFEAAGRFAALVGCQTSADWDKYAAGMKRAELFERVVAVLNRKIMSTGGKYGL